MINWPIVIKLGPARRVDPGVGPVRVCQKTDQRNDTAKPDRLGGSTRDPGETWCFFSSNVEFETH